MVGEGRLTAVPSSTCGHEPNLIEDVTNRPRRSPQRRLEQMVEFDETQAATILKQWVRRESLA